MYIQSGQYLSKPFCSNIGTPQGDSIAAILFSLFLSDIERWIPNDGIELNGVKIGIIMYADDIVLIAESSEKLQAMIDSLNQYCLLNKLEVNTAKTKSMVFHRGRCPRSSFTYAGNEIEIVKSFKYLGFTFTTQLSFSRHVESLIVKARSRIGLLFSKLPIMGLPIDIALKLFDTYISPIFLFGVALWMSNCSNSSKQSLDAVFTKFLKRYLCIPQWTNNATTYFVTQTIPLSSYLKIRAPHMIRGLVFPDCLSGLKLTFLKPETDSPPINLVQQIPSSFWLSKTFVSLPSNHYYRKRLCHEIFDLTHREYCKNTKFHKCSEPNCSCVVCGGHVHPFHARMCRGILSNNSS